MDISLEKAGEILDEAKKIIITAHVNPDGDAVGSSLALFHHLKEKGKDVAVVIDDNIPENFFIIPGAEDILRQKEADENVDLLVVLDASPDRTGKVRDCAPCAKVLNIDHHIANTGEADYLYCDSYRAAIAEILYELFEKRGEKISENTAIALYVALATDTGFFRYSNSTAYTYGVGAELVRLGVKPNLISEALEKRSFEAVKNIAAAIETIEMFNGGKTAGMFMPYETVKNIDSTEGFIDFARIIRGVEVAVFVKEANEGHCRVSLRSKNFDVNKVANTLGGGGHMRAAGCTLNLPLKEAKEKVLTAISEAMGEN